VIENSEIANLTGVFTRGNLNVVQQQILVTHTIRKRRQENELEELRFEQNLFINNPEFHSIYMKKKQEEEEMGDVVWLTPQSIEEQRELDKVFAEMAKPQQRTPEEIAADAAFVEQMTLNNPFDGIDIDEIGGD